MTGPTGHRVSSKSKLKTSGAIISAFSRYNRFHASFQLEKPTMAADRFSTARASARAALVLTVAGAAGAAAPGADRSQPFSVQDMVRLDRLSEIAASPDGKRAAYTLR